jgi:hypothetical protein
MTDARQAGMRQTFPNRWKFAVFLFVLCLLSAAYLGMNLKRGWVPHDEGTLGQSAERVMQGELPHRDFDEPYTGGLAYLDAAAFRFFGVNLMVLRYVLFAFFLLWVPAVFAIAWEFCTPWPAAAITLLAVAWSVPNYPAAMPSWFCLYFATFGVLALLRHLRRPRPFWLVAAGLCGGSSFLMKTPGLYFVAGALLFFVYREQSLAREQVAEPQRATAYRTFLILSLACFVAVLLRVVMPGGGVPEFLHFAFPGIALASFLVVRERFPSSSGNFDRFKRFFALAGPFLAGAVLPVLLFFAFYWHLGALHDLIGGLVAAPLRQFANARVPPPHWVFELFALSLALFFLEKRHNGKLELSSVTAIKILVALAILVTTAKSLPVLVLVLNCARAAMPALVPLALWTLYFSDKKSASGSRDQQIMLLLSVAAMCSLVQFPYADPLYFCYFASLALLAATAVLSTYPEPHRVNICIAGAFFMLFAVFVLRPATLAGFVPEKPDALLALPRAGGLRVIPQEASRYDELIPFVVSLSAGKPIFAGPDCPEVYFLSGLKNPTPILFDFVQGPREYEAQLAQLLDRRDYINVVVLNNQPRFSPRHLSIVRALVTARYSESQKFENFEVFWRQ